jgi:hypothetical protein
MFLAQFVNKVKNNGLHTILARKIANLRGREQCGNNFHEVLFQLTFFTNLN